MNLSQVILSASRAVYSMLTYTPWQRGVQRRPSYHDMGSVNVVTDSEMQDLWQVLVSSTEHVFRRLKEVARELLDYKVALKINDPNEPS
jgi:hypothetical protein